MNCLLPSGCWLIDCLHDWSRRRPRTRPAGTRWARARRCWWWCGRKTATRPSAWTSSPTPPTPWCCTGACPSQVRGVRAPWQALLSSLLSALLSSPLLSSLFSPLSLLSSPLSSLLSSALLSAASCRAHTCKRGHVQMRRHPHKNACTHTRIHTHMHTHTHTRTHDHTRARLRAGSRSWILPPPEVQPADSTEATPTALESEFVACTDEECDLEFMGAKVPLQRRSVVLPPGACACARVCVRACSWAWAWACVGVCGREVAVAAPCCPHVCVHVHACVCARMGVCMGKGEGDEEVKE